MKTKIVLFSSLISVSLFLSSCTHTGTDPLPGSLNTEMLTNTSFETNTPAPSSWEHYNGTQNENYSTWSTDAASSGTHSLKISRATTGSDLIYFYQTMSGAIPVGKDVTFKVKIKGTNIVGPGAAVTLRSDGAEGVTGYIYSGTTTTISGTFDWTEYSVTLYSVSASTKSFIVYLFLLPNTSGTVYYDDASFTTGDTDTGLLLNPGAENTGSFPDDWSHRNGTESTLVETGVTGTTEEASAAQHAVKFFFASPQSDPIELYQSYLKGNLQFGRPVTFKAKIKTANLTGPGIALAIEATGANGQVDYVTTHGITVISGTTDWTEYSIVMPNLNSNTINLYAFVRYLPGTSGTAYADEVSMITH